MEHDFHDSKNEKEQNVQTYIYLSDYKGACPKTTKYSNPKKYLF